MNMFSCQLCDYQSEHKYDLQRHLQSKRHKETSPKEEVVFTYSCEECNYNTNIKQDYERHCKTQRHQDKNKTFTCSQCDKTYKTRNGLYKHKKKHIETRIINTSNQEWKNMILNYIKENNELTNQLIKENSEIKSQLLDIAKQPRIINQKNTFNIVNYLNTECKDAYNLTEFIESLVVTFEDLEHIEEHGYLHGVKNSLIQALKCMEQTKRPIHCTDVKRKQFYIKDENTWKKDKTKLSVNKVIRSFNNKQLGTLLNSGIDKAAESDFKQQDKLNMITQHLTEMYTEKGEKLKDKIIHEICEATTVEK